MITYVAVLIALFEYPLATAIAFIVSDAVTLIDPVYCVEEVVGVQLPMQ